MNSLFSWGSPLALQLLPPTHLQQTPTSPSAKNISYQWNRWLRLLVTTSLYLDVCKHWGSLLVKQTLKGAWRMCSKGVCWKKPLSVQDLESVWMQLKGSSSFDNLLFKAQLNTRFMGLLCLGELVKNNKPALQDWKKITMRHSLEWLPNTYTFSLPHHKSDLVFEGNCVICRRIMGAPDPLWIMHKYINVHDHLYPLHPQLWLRSDGLTPICTWWICQFWWFFPDSNLAG